MHYKADFEYYAAGAGLTFDRVIEDVKGFQTDRFKLVKKLWPFSGPAPLNIVKQDRRGNWIVTETVKGKT